MNKITLLILVLSFFSCSTSDDSTEKNQDNNKIRLIEVKNKRVDVDWEETTKFSYKDGDLYEIEYSQKGSDFYNYKLMYQEDINNTINEFHYSRSGKIEFVNIYSKLDNKIVKLHSREYDSNTIVDYTYSGENVIEVISTNIDLNKKLGQVNYLYDLSNNVINEKYNFGELKETYYTYDLKNNPYSLVYNESFQRIFLIGKNNRLSEKSSNINYKYEYTYNQDGFPITMKTYENDIYKFLTTYSYNK